MNENAQEIKTVQQPAAQQAPEPTPAPVIVQKALPAPVPEVMPTKREAPQWVSDLIGEDFKTWGPGVVLIDAGTGAGKTTFVVQKLGQEAKRCKEDILYLCNRKSLKSQVIEQAVELGIAKELDADEPDRDKKDDNTSIYIWTYQALEKMKLYHSERLEIFLQKFRYIIVDEAHYFIFDAQFNKDTIVSYEVLKSQWVTKVVIYMSATADYMFEHLENMDAVKKKQHYTITKNTEYVKRLSVYWNDRQLECQLNSIPDGEKALVFLETTEEIKRWREKYGNDAAGYCSPGNVNTKKEDGLWNLDACLKNCILQKKYTFVTKALDNGIDIKDETLKHIFVETWDIDEAMQMFGRKRPMSKKDTCTFYIRGISNTQAKRLYEQVLNDLEPGEALLARDKGHNSEKWDEFRKKSDALERLYKFTSTRIEKDTPKIEYNRMAIAGLRRRRDILKYIQDNGYIKTLKQWLKWGLQDKVKEYTPPENWRKEMWKTIEEAIEQENPIRKCDAQEMIKELFQLEKKPSEEEATELLKPYKVTVTKTKWRKDYPPELTDKMVWLLVKK